MLSIPAADLPGWGVRSVALLKSVRANIGYRSRLISRDVSRASGEYRHPAHDAQVVLADLGRHLVMLDWL